MLLSWQIEWREQYIHRSQHTHSSLLSQPAFSSESVGAAVAVVTGDSAGVENRNNTQEDKRERET